MFFRTITGAQTPACLYAASDPVETVTPPNLVELVGASQGNLLQSYVNAKSRSAIAVRYCSLIEL